jgi:hypothetical protein
MDLAVVEGKPEIGLVGFVARQAVPIKIRCVIVVAFVVAHSRHEGSVGSKALSLLPIQVPHGFKFTNLFGADASISNIACQEHKVIRLEFLLRHNQLSNHVPQGCIGAHIAKDGHSDLTEG